MASIRPSRLPKKLVVDKPISQKPGSKSRRGLPTNNPNGRPSIYPFSSIAVGEGFRIGPELKSADRAATYVHQRNRALAPKRFQTTFLSDGGVYVARIA